jgi:hypothetical protein
MPLEIRELYIKVTVNEPPGGAARAVPPPGASKPDDEKEAIIRQCVDEVINIINKKNER